jgi:HNH endonuclease
MLSQADRERFWAAVQKTEGCWIWTHSKQTWGYGQVSVRGRNCYAHRIAFSELVGEIPKGKSVLHRCDNPACVRPDHPFLGTHTDNMRDAAAKGRLHIRIPPQDAHGRWAKRA